MTIGRHPISLPAVAREAGLIAFAALVYFGVRGFTEDRIDRAFDNADTAAPRRGGARDRLGASVPGAAARSPMAPDAHELGVRVRPLARDRGLRDRALRLASRPIRPAPQRDVHLRAHRLPLLRGCPDGATADGRPRRRGHGDRILGGVSRPPAAGPDEQVRGVSEPARRLEPAPRDRALPGDDAPRCPRVRHCDAGGHGVRRRREREPLRARRRRRRRGRPRGARAGEGPGRTYNRPRG